MRAAGHFLIDRYHEMNLLEKIWGLLEALETPRNL